MSLLLTGLSLDNDNINYTKNVVLFVDCRYDFLVDAVTAVLSELKVKIYDILASCGQRTERKGLSVFQPYSVLASGLSLT